MIRQRCAILRARRHGHVFEEIVLSPLLHRSINMGIGSSALLSGRHRSRGVDLIVERR